MGDGFYRLKDPTNSEGDATKDKANKGLPKKRNSRNPRNPVTVTKSTV